MDRDALLQRPPTATLDPIPPSPPRLAGEQGFPWTGLTLLVVIFGLLAFLAIPRPRPQNREIAPPAAAGVPILQKASPIR